MDVGLADEPAFEAWYRTNGTVVLRALVLDTGDLTTGRQRANDALAALYNRVRAGDHVANPLAWTVVYGFSIRPERPWRRHRPTPSSPGPRIADPGTTDGLRQAIARLPRRQRRPIILRYVVQLDDEAIGVALGVPTRRVATLLSRGRQVLARSGATILGGPSDG